MAKKSALGDRLEMALSDSCFEFLSTIVTAADELSAEVHHYSAPDRPIQYGAEIDALRRACVALKEAPYDPEAGARLFRLAASVMTFHDTPPNSEEFSHRANEMKQLVLLLQRELGDGDDATCVPAVVAQAVAETQYTQEASVRLRELLSKLGKSSYDIAIRIISDVGSATAKKILGL